MLEAREDPGVDFYNPDKATLAAPLRDNLLFGRVDASIANAAERVRHMGQRVIREMNLSSEIERVGLDHAVGPYGRRLTALQRAAISLIRCLVKRPDLLVVDGALTPFTEQSVTGIAAFLEENTKGTTFVSVLPNDRNLGLFQSAIGFQDGKIVAIATKAIATKAVGDVGQPTKPNSREAAA